MGYFEILKTKRHPINNTASTLISTNPRFQSLNCCKSPLRVSQCFIYLYVVNPHWELSQSLIVDLLSTLVKKSDQISIINPHSESLLINYKQFGIQFIYILFTHHQYLEITIKGEFRFLLIHHWPSDSNILVLLKIYLEDFVASLIFP